MVVDTGKKHNLAAHLDKIAYGSALVVGLLIILLPVLATRNLRSVGEGIEEGRAKVEARQRETPDLAPVPRLTEIIRAQWESPPPLTGPWIPPWVLDPRPAVVQLYEGATGAVAMHQPGSIKKISYERDKAKRQVFLRVEAARGTVENARFTKTKLQRGEVLEKGADLEWAEVVDLEESLVYQDYAVVPGKKYAYRLLTEVEVMEGNPGGKVTIGEEDRQKTSENLALKEAVPYDYALKIISATPFDPRTNTPSRMNGEIWCWDYSQNKVVKPQKTVWAEEGLFGEKVSGRERYRIVRIDEDKVTVQDRSLSSLPRESLTSRTGRRPVDLPGEMTPQSALPDAAKEDPAKALNGGGGPNPPEPKVEKDEKKPAAPKPAPKDKTKDKGKEKKKKRPGIK